MPITSPLTSDTSHRPARRVFVSVPFIVIGPMPGTVISIGKSQAPTSFFRTSCSGPGVGGIWAKAAVAKAIAAARRTATRKKRFIEPPSNRYLRSAPARLFAHPMGWLRMVAGVRTVVIGDLSGARGGSGLRRERREGETQPARVGLQLHASVALAVDDPELVGEPLVLAGGDALIEAQDPAQERRGLVSAAAHVQSHLQRPARLREGVLVAGQPVVAHHHRRRDGDVRREERGVRVHRVEREEPPERGATEDSIGVYIA
jgi:hypothetical protein